jgi:hypothetical protein
MRPWSPAVHRCPRLALSSALPDEEALAMADKLTVHDPRGYPPKVEAKRLAPSLDRLDGRMLYLVDGRFNGTAAFMEQLQAWLGEHMPSVKTRVIRWREPFDDDPEASEEIRANADAAILGVGI